MSKIQGRPATRALAYMHKRFKSGHWASGWRYNNGARCLVSQLDDACKWMPPGTAVEVEKLLVAELPTPLRAVAKVNRRVALIAYNDWFGGRDKVITLIGAARRNASAGRISRRTELRHAHATSDLHDLAAGRVTISWTWKLATKPGRVLEMVGGVRIMSSEFRHDDGSTYVTLTIHEGEGHEPSEVKVRSGATLEIAGRTLKVRLQPRMEYGILLDEV